MGSLHAGEFARDVDRGHISLEVALEWHLRHNHYPPVPTSMVPVCIAAIEAGNDEEWDRQIDLPEGCSYRGSETAPASAIIEGHHLESFLQSDDWEDEDEADWEDDEEEDGWDDDDEEDDDWDDEGDWDDED